ncbi:MAG: ABC transporter substrate-binding protein [Candidatus Caldarchaeum sp.]|nr:ABC transporter substrate-binding protein [Candidatus Caldarchaeum sp.]
MSGSVSNNVGRRTLLSSAAAAAVGIAVGFGSGYLARQPETRLVTTTLTAAGGLVTRTETLTRTLTQTQLVTVSPTKREVRLRISAAPSSIIPFLVASREGFDRELSLIIEPQRVGYEVEADLFQAGREPIGDMAPWEAARLVAGGTNAFFTGNAGAVRFFNSMFVRTEDADKYKNPKDLVGKTIGLPPWASGTTTAFIVAAKALWNIDPRRNYEVKVAESAALLPLLERKEVEAVLLFSGHTLAALSQPQKYTKIFSFSDTWETAFGQPLTITGRVTRKDWFRENWEIIRNLDIVLDKSVRWIMANSREFVEADGKYVKDGELAGWTRDEMTRQTVKAWLSQGKYFLIESYSPAWVDANWDFIRNSEGVIIEKLPKKEDVFRNPLRWPGI